MKNAFPALILAALVVFGCDPPKEPPAAQPTGNVYVEVWDGGKPGVKVAGATVTLDGHPKQTAVANHEGNIGFLNEAPGARHIWVTAEGFLPHDQHIDIPEGDLHVPVTLRPVRQARRGIVRLSGRAFVDGDGTFSALGATLFWGVWGYQHDRERLDKTLAYLSDRGVDFVRVLGVVGPSGEWEDRLVTSREPDYEAAIAGLTDLAYERGLRVEWTIFGGIDSTPTPESRRALVERFIRMAKGREHKILMWEVANEGWQTGFRDREAEARELGRLLRAKTPNLVAVTADTDPCAQRFYDGGAGSIRTAHLDRSQQGEGGLWRPVRQPWEMQFCSDPSAWTSNEPIGPGATVNADDDPLRLTMSAATVYLAGGAAYVYHARPGIRGGGAGDMKRGGPANWWEVKNVERTFAGLKATRALLPADLPNWTRHNANSRFPDRPFDVADEDFHLRSYCATKGADVVCLPLQVKAGLRLVARRAIAGTVYHPLTGAELKTFRLAAGEALTLDGRPEAVILRGRW